MNYRIFVEKYDRFEVETRSMEHELNVSLGLRLKELRLVNIYDLFGFTPELLEKCRYQVFGETVTDRVTDTLNLEGKKYVAIENLPGQFDQRASSAVDCVKLIEPEADVEIRPCFYLPENADTFDFSEYSYVVDAVDTVTAKIQLVMEAAEAGVPIISSMGAGNKLDPTAFQVADIYKTSVCPLAKVMRRELKKRGIKKLKVVYSREQPVVKNAVPASVAFVPSVVGLIIAGEVIKDLAKAD